MPYTINKYSGPPITVVADGTIDSTLDIKLIGKNYAGYGEVQNENLVFMLENFSSSSTAQNGELQAVLKSDHNSLQV